MTAFWSFSRPRRQLPSLEPRPPCRGREATVWAWPRGRGLGRDYREARRLRQICLLRPEAEIPNLALPESRKGRQFDPVPDRHSVIGVRHAYLRKRWLASIGQDGWVDRDT